MRSRSHSPESTPSAASPATARPGESGGQTEPVRLLIVGAEDALCHDIRRAFRAAGVAVEPVFVEHYLAALGELSAPEPVGMLIGQYLGPLEAMTASASAIRELAPQAHLLLLVDAYHEADAAALVERGFDEYLLCPFQSEALAAILARHLPARGTHPPGAMAPPPRPASPRDKASTTMPGPAAESAIGPGTEAPPSAPTAGPGESMGSAQADPPRAEPPAQQPGPIMEHPAAADAAQQMLGDIDLVERLLHQPEAMPETALALIAQRSGLPDLQFQPDAGPAAESARSAPLPPVRVPVIYNGRTYGTLASAEPATMDDLTPWAGWLARWLALKHHVTELAAQAMRDELTGLYNRRYFNRFLDEVVERAQRERFCVTLLMFDIDNFKLYNDRHGYASGDGVLLDTGRLMQSVVRDHDVVARIGGDEFAVVFWDKEEPRRANSKHPMDVSKVAERFQRAIRDHHFPRLGEGALSRLTISGGMATFPWDGHERDDLLRVADRMLRQSKTQGKNVITLGPGVAAACGNGMGRTQPEVDEMQG